MSAAPKKVALAVTSYHGPFYEDGAKTGTFYVEAYHPFKAFTDAGLEVDIVSETGSFGWDEHSLSPDFRTDEEYAVSQDPQSSFSKALKNIKKASDAKASDYSIINIAGGHGTVFDFVGKAPHLAKLASEIWNNKGYVVAVCHGPCLLPYIIDSETGKSIANGRKATGFPDGGETVLKLDNLLQTKGYEYTSNSIKESGANFQNTSPPFEAHVIVDGRLITGANPASATPAAEASLKLLGL